VALFRVTFCVTFSSCTIGYVSYTLGILTEILCELAGLQEFMQYMSKYCWSEHEDSFGCKNFVTPHA